MFSVQVSELITQEHIATGASDLVEGVTMWPANDHWPRSKCQRSRSQGHVMYQQQERYNYATDGHINFKHGGNFHRDGRKTWHTF